MTFRADDFGEALSEVSGPTTKISVAVVDINSRRRRVRTYDSYSDVRREREASRRLFRAIGVTVLVVAASIFVALFFGGSS